MGNKVYPLGVLCAFIILCSFISSTQSASCCLGYITNHRIHCRRFVDYAIQNIYGRCDLHAVIFRTVSNRTVCADPSLNSTKNVMRCIEERKRIV